MTGPDQPDQPADQPGGSEAPFGAFTPQVGGKPKTGKIHKSEVFDGYPAPADEEPPGEPAPNPPGEPPAGAGEGGAPGAGMLRAEPSEPPAPYVGQTATDDGHGVLLDPQAALEPAVPPPAAPDGTSSNAVGQPISARGADGRVFEADYRPPNGADQPGHLRWAVSVIETKVPYDQRPTRGLLDTPEQCADRGYRALWQPLDPNAAPGDPAGQLGAPDAADDDPAHGVGVQAWWSAYFTEAEVETLRAAPNVESVTYAHRVGPVDSEYAASFTRRDMPDWFTRAAATAANAQRGSSSHGGAA